MTTLERLYSEHGQSPWIDNLRREWLRSGHLAGLVERGVRGVTSNPTIFEKAISSADDYDDQLATLVGEGRSIEDAYWELVVTDVVDALDVLAPVHESSRGRDGFVSIEVSPVLAQEPQPTLDAVRWLRDRIRRPNLLVKIPGTHAGLDAIRAAVADGISVNVTLLFALERYGAVIDAWMDGLEQRLAAGGDLTGVNSVASFFVSRVDTEVDRRLTEIGSPEALALRGKTAIANAQLAYALFQERAAGERWQALAAAGATPQRPLWASTSTKNPDYPDTLYVDTLIGPDTVNTLTDATLEAFSDHGVLARTVDDGLDEARAHLDAVRHAGVDLEAVTALLEDEGVAAFTKSFEGLLDTLQQKSTELGV